MVILLVSIRHTFYIISVYSTCSLSLYYPLRSTYPWLHIQGDQKVSVHLTITVQKKHAKIQYFKQFQSPTMIT